MILSGTSGASLLLEPTDQVDATLLLRPRISADPIDVRDYNIGSPAGPVRAWTPAQVSAAAAWWTELACDRIPVESDVAWFGGGVCLRRVAAEPGQVAIDVLILADPDGPRPPVDQWEDGGRFTYITVDTTPDDVDAAAAWWRSQ